MTRHLMVNSAKCITLSYAFASHNPTIALLIRLTCRRNGGVCSPSGTITTDGSKTEGVSFTPFYINHICTALLYASLLQAYSFPILSYFGLCYEEKMWRDRWCL